MSLQRDKHEGQRVAQRERECMAWREAPCERERLKKKREKRGTKRDLAEWMRGYARERDRAVQ
jgi:hypothetical protein